MSQDHFLELVPLAALGVLDGDDRVGFEDHMPGCVVCHAELAIYEKVAGLIPLALNPTPPGSRVREEILGRPGRPGRTWPALLATAASVALGLALLVVRAQRDAARVELVAAHAEGSDATAFRALVQRPGSRITALGGLAPAPAAHARMIWDPETREAVLVASGLAPAPAGLAYEAWVIAGGAPVAAGTFHPDRSGGALLQLPLLAETAAARTFAVTLEPEAGVSAPSGPMVLAGGV